MDQEDLKKLSEDGLSIYDMAKKYQKGYSTIRYWLIKYKIKTNEALTRDINKEEENNEIGKRCASCKELKQKSDFYKNNSRHRGYCKRCSSEYHQNRLRRVKIKMIQYKGGCCEKCYLKLENSHYSVFDFHHLDPATKDPNFSGIKSQKWEKIKNEIDRCKLLCSNCHRLTHAEISLSFKIDDVIYQNNNIGKSLWSDVEENEGKKCECGKKINKLSNFCKDCYKKTIRRQDRPQLSVLISEVSELGYRGTGKKYGVSDNSIRKWIKSYKQANVV